METVTLADLGQNAPCADINGNHDNQEEIYSCEAQVLTPVTLNTDKVSVGTITELCHTKDLPEVDLISLVEEQIPRYRLRADTITSFSGYEHNDFIKTPVLRTDVELDLSLELIEETLKYFILCAERVTQMTKAYNDIEAVTSLLEEKERDLELAARIGQSLLERNKELEEKNSEYEVQLVEANDKIKQLRHEVSQKEALLQMYLHEEELSSDTPEDERLQLSVGVANIVGLQKKVQSLEAENFKLIKQTASLKTETALQEEKEQSLFRDCVRQLEDYKNQVIQLQDELLTKSDTNLRQQEEITSLTEKKVALEAQNRKLLEDLEELKKSLTAAHVVQQELTSEIAELEKKNEELEVLLCEKQEEIKSLRKKQKPAYIRHHSNYNSPFLPEDSLALELQDCFRRGFDYIPGYSTEERREHNRRAFRTARAVRQASRNSRSSANSSYGNESESTVGSPLPTSHCPSECELSDGGYGADIDSVLSSNLGKPPLSGASDLDFALSRLATTKSDKQNNNDLSRCHTPDSMMSVSSFGNLSEVSRLSGRLPEKLQLVKPLEGSQTLHHWKRLATPHLAGILEHRPGIQNKGENIVESEYEETYSLSDYEEDGMSTKSSNSLNLYSKCECIDSTNLDDGQETVYFGDQVCLDDAKYTFNDLWQSSLLPHNTDDISQSPPVPRSQCLVM